MEFIISYENDFTDDDVVHKDKSILDELLGLNEPLHVYNESSVCLHEIMNSSFKYKSDEVEVTKFLRDEIIFLRGELKQKNLIINKLMDNSTATPVKKLPTTNLQSCCSPQKVMNLNDSNMENNQSSGLENDILFTTHVRDDSCFRYTLGSTEVSSLTSEQTSSTPLTSSPPAREIPSLDTDIDTIDNENEISAKRYAWEKHSTGVASRILNKMGYKGKGLGKTENGITEALTNENLAKINTAKIDTKRRRKLLYILSSSMLNQMDGGRLSNNRVEVRVQCHGGCTIRCLYSHLPNVIASKPDHILLHIGSNDCTSKTSDEVLKELKSLLNHLKLLLPYTIVTLSLPLIRSDNPTAAAIQKNLNVKMRKLPYPFLDNHNISYDHLGKKGLHLNDHGTRIMAKNIISLVKRT